MSEDNENIHPEELNQQGNGNLPGQVKAVSGMYENWFLDYASYVILERAVPAIEDGLKPVQRRILYAMKEMDDGRFNKVANIIGQTMQYHPHGDAAIGDAIVNMGQKDLLIETQGNWGDIRTGDSAAASRYIEARLSPLALDILFNHQTTFWVNSYDGRKREPLTLPAKFPLVLAQGVEGIAVGLATKIMPHNFVELCKASVDLLKGKDIELFPDFPTGGMADFSNYNQGKKGSRIRVRAKIEQGDNKSLLIKEIPFGTTTGSIIDSILKANENGKIKIKKVVDNTAQFVEIEIQLAPGTSPEMTIDALYAFTECEVSISPNACVISDNKPLFLGVDEMLEISTNKTKDLLKWELEIKLSELEEKWHFSSLEKIFIEERIYRDIEECETWEDIILTIDKGLEPFKPRLRREVTREDIVRLTEIKIKRISKFDSFKADELLKSIEEQIEETKHHLANLIDYAISWFETLLKKYGKGRERKTEIRMFDNIEANVVAVANEKLYANFKEGFVGIGLKKDEFVCDCSDIDDIIAFRADGKYLISKVANKQFMGKDLIHVDVFRKNDDRKVYNVVYVDGKSKVSYVKRFSVPNLIRDKEYDLTTGTPGSKIIYFSANNNSEAEQIGVYLSNLAKARNKFFHYDFAELAIKGRNSKGNLLTKHPVRKIEMTQKGVSTEKGRELYFEKEVGKLNVDGRGEFLGTFTSEDRILTIYNDGSYEVTDNELIRRFEGNQVMLMQKFYPKLPVNVLHLDPVQQKVFVKRFLIETNKLNKRFVFISEKKGAKLITVSTFENPEVELTTKNKKGEKTKSLLKLADLIEVKGWKAMGNKVSNDAFVSAKLLSPVVGETNVKDTVVPDDDSGNDNNPALEFKPEEDAIANEEKKVETQSPKKDEPKKDKYPEIKMTVKDVRTIDPDTDTFGQKSLFDL
jgi:topoisomerase IV subunit A